MGTVGGTIGSIKIEVDLPDNGKEINSGPNSLGTVKEDKIGVRMDGHQELHIEILVLTNNGETSKHQVNRDKTGISQLMTNNGLNLHKVVGRIHRVYKRPKQ